VITTTVEYEKAQAELQDLQERLAELQRNHPIGEKGFTKAGIRKLIARLNEELAVFEGSEEARSSPSPGSWTFGNNRFQRSNVSRAILTVLLGLL
jgi:hypothetical protein